MDHESLIHLLNLIRGCTFATLDAVTFPRIGIRCHTNNERILLFTNKNVSGYEQMVRRRLIEAGKDPDSFVLSELPWGERIPDSPLIQHNSELYLQTVRLVPGEKLYFAGQTDRQVNPKSFGIRERNNPGQGLPTDRQVFVSTYKLESITRIALMGTELVSEPPVFHIPHRVTQTP